MKKILVLLLLLVFISLPRLGSAMECIDLSTNLRYGTKDSKGSAQVYQLQAFLKEKGYLNVNATGYFGTMTLRAVKSFQKDNAIPQTGFVGPLTRASIKRITCADSQVSPIPEELPVSNSNDSTKVPDSIPPVAPEDPAPVVTIPVVEDTILTAPNNSSLKVRTDGVVGLGSNTVTVKGTVTAGARSATERWFELTKNPDVYKLSETAQSVRKLQRSNDNFQETFNDLTPGTTYYFRACSENKDLGQKSCGTTISLKTNN